MMGRIKRALLDRGVLGSLVLHVLLGLVLWASDVQPAVDPSAEQSIDVQVVVEPGPPRPAVPGPASPPLSTEPPPPPAPPASARSEPVPAAHESEPPPSPIAGMVRPKTMLSARILSGPRGRDARTFLGRLAGDARIEQLCGIEAMAQVGAWNRAFQPDRLVAYAMADPEMTDRAFVAEGAAFHSRGQWFAIRLRCGLTPDRSRVASLDFAVGAAIPKAEWLAHNLPSENGTGD